jgi:hypothetical protein
MTESDHYLPFKRHRRWSKTSDENTRGVYEINRRTLYLEPDAKELLSHALAVPMSTPRAMYRPYVERVRYYRRGYRTPFDYFLAHPQG